MGFTINYMALYLRYPLDRGLRGPQRRFRRREEDKILYLTSTQNPAPLLYRPYPVTIPTELSRLRNFRVCYFSISSRALRKLFEYHSGNSSFLWIRVEKPKFIHVYSCFRQPTHCTVNSLVTSSVRGKTPLRRLSNQRGGPIEVYGPCFLHLLTEVV
jgi:hypothetical protein